MIVLLFTILAGFPPPDDYPMIPYGDSTGSPAVRFGVTWEYMAPNPGCAVSRTVAVLGTDNRIHLICGNCPIHGSHPYDEVYDPAANTWQTGLTYPGGGGVHNHSAALLGTKIYVGGGRQGSSFTDDLTVLDLAANTWTVVGKMPNQSIPHYYYQFAAAQGKIYMFGGIKNDTIFTAETWCYDPATNSWSPKRAMPQAKMSVSAVTIADTIFVCGGSATYPNGSRGVYAYDYAGDTWVVKGESLLVATFWASGHVVPDPDTGWHIYIVGGQNRTNYLTAVQKKHTNVLYWSSETPIAASRRSHGGTQKGCSLYVACGWNGAGISSAERGRVNLIGIEEEYMSRSLPGNDNRVMLLSNPSRDQIRIRLSNDRARRFHITLFDVNGRLRATLFKGRKESGTHHFRLSLRDTGVEARVLPPGAYFLIVDGFGQIIRRKIIIAD